MLRCLLTLGLVSCVAALPAGISSSLENRGDGFNPPRSVLYIQTFHYPNGSDLSLLPLVKDHTRATHIYLAAVHVDSPPGVIHLNDNNPNDTIFDNIWNEAAKLQNDGVKVMVMLGGAARGSYKNLCSGDGSDDGVVISEDYYGPLRDTLAFHKVDGVDLDIEETVSIDCPIALLKRFNKDFGSDFILTMAPVASDLDGRDFGLGGFSYTTMDAKAKASNKPNGKLVNWFNVQFYNGFGDASSPAGYNAIVKQGFSADRVVFGIPATPTDGSGWFNISTYQNVISTLAANYDNFGGNVGWEYWDAGSMDNLAHPWQWVKAIGNAVFGPKTAQTNFRTDFTEGVAPFPVQMNALSLLNVTYLEAVKALNVTDGNLDAALQWLGLSDLLPLRS